MSSGLPRVRDRSVARRLVGVLHIGWQVGCVAVLFALIGARWLRYTHWSALPALDGVSAELMVLDVQAFLWPWVYTQLKLRIVLLAALTLVLALHRRLPSLLVRRVDGTWRLTPITVSALLGGMVWLHYALDLNPTVASACALSLVLTVLLANGRIAAALPTSAPVVIWGAFFAWAVFAAHDSIDRLTILVWAIVLLTTHYSLGTRMAGRDLLLLRGLSVIPMNLLASALPLVVPLHHGAWLGDGLAYAFCEVPGRPTLFATVPVCGSVRTTYDDCGRGRIVEYDLGSLKRVAEHDFFSPDFYGRLEYIVCLDDEVQVAVQGAWLRGQSLVHTALAFPLANPRIFNPAVPGARAGVAIAYDRAHEAVFYGSEFTHRIVRYDRRTDQRRDIIDPQLAYQWFQPVTLDGYDGSLLFYNDSIHPGRGRLYVGDWMQGRYAYALDLETLQVVARYDVGGGGTLGVSVDPARDRLFIASSWGIEVVDLATDTVIARKRTGLGNRPPIVDAARNRLYVASMVEGKMRILDRDTLEVVGQIPIGFGGRFAHLSLDGKRLFASSAAAHYYWDADTLPGG